MPSRTLLLNTLCEFGPILAFMLAYHFADFEQATLAMIGATLLALFVLYTTEGHIPRFALLSTLTVLIFGGVSLFVHLPSIFILRDTVFDLIFGIVLISSTLMGRPLLKPLFANVFHITDRGWNTLSLRWGFFFILLGGLNEWVRLTLHADTWVTFKLITIVATIAFGCMQFFLARRERLPDASPWGLVR